MEIKLEEYLTGDEIKSIVQNEFCHYIHSELKTRSIDTWVSILSYKTVWKIVDEYIRSTGRSDNIEELMQAKVRAMIEELSSYQVFRSRDKICYSSDSEGQKLLDKVVKECEPLIKERVEEIIKDIDLMELREDINQTLYDMIADKLGLRTEVTE
ncbi:MAG: hypothetical protein IJ740_08490 [Ruminococcus sp.]|nr:hypothetical protein [Ruminococcus sp.]